MSLDVTLLCPCCKNVLYTANITHNLNEMAGAAGIYKALWRPEEIGAEMANDIIPILSAGLDRLRANPEKFEAFNAPNGWGLYIHFVPFVAGYLKACEENPTAKLSVCR